MSTITLIVPTWKLAKHSGATKTYAMKMGELIPTGVTISSSTWTATVAEGTDANPSAIISGTADITGDPEVKHLLTAGVDGVTYCVKNTAVLSDGQTIVALAKLVVDDGCS